MNYKAKFIHTGTAGIGIDSSFSHWIVITFVANNTTLVPSLSIFLSENFVFCNTVRNCEEKSNLLSLQYSITYICVYLGSIITQGNLKAEWIRETFFSCMREWAPGMALEIQTIKNSKYRLRIEGKKKRTMGSRREHVRRKKIANNFTKITILNE